MQLPETCPPRIVLAWNDASYNTEDIKIDEMGDLVCLYECGFLLKETPHSYVICHEYQPDADTSRLAITVPKCNVIWKRIIRSKVI